MKTKFVSSFCLVTLYFLFGHSNDRMVYGQTITTYAGNHTYGYTGDGGAATAAEIGHPAHGIYSSSGALYFADYGNRVVRKVSSSGVITTFAGTGGTGSSGDGGPATAAQINTPDGMCFDASGNFYVVDFFNYVIRKVDASGTISRFAGTGVSGFSGDGGPATAAKMSPGVIATDHSGNIYICDYNTNRIRKINTSGIISTIVGTGTAGFSGDGGPATAAKIYQPTGVAADAFGNIYFADQLNNRIRKINTLGIVSTIAGNGSSGYTGDGGPATAATMFYPSDVVIDGAGNILFADSYNNVIRMVSPSGIISTAAGNGTSGYSGDGGPASSCEMNQPWGVALGSCGDLFIFDANNNVVREIGYSGSLSPISGPDSICNGNTIALTESTTGGVWGSSDTSIATVTAMTGVVNGRNVGTAIITYSGGNGCGTGYVTHSITVSPAPSAGTIAIIESSICPGDTIRMNDAATGGTWISENTAIASITGSGLATGVAGGTDTVFYIVTNACGSDTAVATLSVLSAAVCHEGVQSLSGALLPKITVFPDPNNGTFILNCSLPDAENVHVVIVNILGELVSEFNLAANIDKRLELNTPPGVYLVSAFTKNTRLTARMVIEK